MIMKQSVLIEWLSETSEENKKNARDYFRNSGYLLTLNNTNHSGFCLANNEDKFDEITSKLSSVAKVYLIEAE